MITAPDDQRYFPALDGIRGLAILLVVCYHNFGFINYFFFGWLGVDLFFVLSGFLITRILLNGFGKPGFLKNFYVRRVLRIFPLYYLSLIVFVLLLPAIADTTVNFDYYQQHQLWLWTYLQNWLYIFHESPNTNALHHLWSLAVEEQFYLFWPLVILLFRKPAVLAWMVLLLLLGVIALRCWLWVYRVEDLAYFNLYTFSRIDGLCIGSLLALLRHRNTAILQRYTTIIVLMMAVLNFAFYFFNRDHRFEFPYLAIVGYTTFAVIFALLVNETLDGKNRIVNGIFTWKPLRFFGKISYGLYIIHWPVYLLLAPSTENWLAGITGADAAPLLTSLLLTAAATILSVISFRYFESYFLRMKTRFA